MTEPLQPAPLKRRIRTVMGIALLALAALMLAGGWWIRGRASNPEAVLLLSDGTVFHVKGLTYGTNHVMGPLWARLTTKLPAPLRNFVQRIIGPGRLSRVTSSQPELHVWLDYRPPGPSPPAGLSYQCALASPDGFVSGEVIWLWTPSAGMVSAGFAAWPRRHKTMQFVLFARGTNWQSTELGRITLPNPRFRNYPEWIPARLPATQRTDRVEVVLEQFGTGFGSGTTHKHLGHGRVAVTGNTNRSVGQEMHSCFFVRVHPRADTNEVWVLANGTLSDATGNTITAVSLTHSSVAGGLACGMAPSLWPDEKAWKLELEFKRTSGFRSNEIVQFRIPLPPIGATNRLNLSAQLDSITIQLDEFVRRPPLTNSTWSSSQLSSLKVTHTKLPEGWHLDLAEARTGSGEEVSFPSVGWTDSEHTFSFEELPKEARWLDVTLAVHQGQWVSFLVRPRLGAEVIVESEE